MENELRIRLNQAREKLKEIDEKLMDSNIMSDILVFKNLSKEKANLDPIIETFDKFEKLESDLEDAKLMLNDSDEEIVKFAKESIINLNEQLQKDGFKNSFKVNDFNEIPEIILSNAKSGDIIVSLGAGSIKNLIYTLPKLLLKK